MTEFLQSPELAPFAEKILEGNIAALSRAITLAESHLPHHQEFTAALMEHLSAQVTLARSFRLGITGVPGVGKSSFIESFGQLMLDHYAAIGEPSKLAVLSIDPSSQRTKGSILGDKVRMESLARRADVFIRPSPTGGVLGGVARSTRESIALCEAAGFSLIFVETVGVGQSEIAVHSLTDAMLLLLLAGAGDELQGMKRGIMEMIDFAVINKADGENKTRALLAKQMASDALHYLPKSPSGWAAATHAVSSLNGEGLSQLLHDLLEFRAFVEKTGWITRNRESQSIAWFRETAEREWWHHLESNSRFDALFKEFETAIAKRNLSPFYAAKLFLRRLKDELP
ncbi:MAG: methylmalonyl Co-A mutase-associated GTPase MeaB [Chloroherpetonaceae bacterium]|nr:methylmalonyl Co-A mutase-associated GTPase MeaB [Chloroherpetonaceae bacterium]